MSEKRIYYGYTTPQQRKQLFEIWQETKNIEEACRKAHVSQRLFYYWKPRFEERGFTGLEEFASRVAHKLNYKAPEIEQKVVEMRRAHPEWGKARISDEMAKANNWEEQVSPNTVKRILRDANLWPETGERKKKSSM